MFLCSKYKIAKDLIVRIYDDGASLSEAPVAVDSENKSSNIESMYKNIEALLEANNFIPECIEEVMEVVKKQTKVVKVPFKTVRISENDIIKVVYIQNGKIQEAIGAISKIYEAPVRHVFFAGNKNISKVIITLDTSREYEFAQVEMLLDDIRDIEIIEKREEDPFGDEYPEYEDLNPENIVIGESYREVINNEELSLLTFTSGMFEEEILIKRSTPIKLHGNYVGIPGKEAERVIIDPYSENKETIIANKITIENIEDTVADVTFDGFTFYKDSLIDIKCEGNITFKNCRFDLLTADKLKSFIITSSDSKPVKLVIEDCYFGTNNENEVGKIYNGLELNCILKDGSSISNNYFEKSTCTHNIINIYNVEEDATISINNNFFEYSGNAIRIGIKGEPKCTINIDGNEYNETDANDEYAGLVLVQPYGKETTSFANCTINITNTKHDDEKQLYYLYAGEDDMQFTEENKPVIITDEPVVEEPETPEPGEDVEYDPTNPENPDNTETVDPDDGIYDPNDSDPVEDNTSDTEATNPDETENDGEPTEPEDNVTPKEELEIPTESIENVEEEDDEPPYDEGDDEEPVTTE